MYGCSLNIIKITFWDAKLLILHKWYSNLSLQFTFIKLNLFDKCFKIDQVTTGYADSCVNWKVINDYNKNLNEDTLSVIRKNLN